MLWFERQVVAALMKPSFDDEARSMIEEYVDRTLRSMPEHLRMGVVAESLILGAWPRFQYALGRFDPKSVEKRAQRWRASRVDPIRQYVRMLQSLVIFAEIEMTSEPDR